MWHRDGTRHSPGSGQKDTNSEHPLYGFRKHECRWPSRCHYTKDQSIGLQKSMFSILLSFLLIPRCESFTFKYRGVQIFFSSTGNGPSAASRGVHPEPPGTHRMQFQSPRIWRWLPVTCSPKYSTSKASCSLILSSSLMPPPDPPGLGEVVFRACLSLFKLSSIFLTECRMSDTVSQYLEQQNTPGRV